MKKVLTCLLFLFSTLYLFAQEEFFMTGLLPDDGTYDQLPRKAELLTRDYTVLPSRYSLLPYCPEVRSQSRYGTCASWAAAYAARTITEAVKYGWTDREKITREAFSPLFVYAQIKEQNDDNCQRGSHIHQALKLMKDKGVPKFSSFSVLCASSVSSSLIAAANPYKIDDYFTLFSISFTDGFQKIRKVKKAVSEDCPVIIAMWLPASFHQAGAYWSGVDVDPSKHGYHAMCVVGYDDTQNGGSFQIMNSWGKTWGDNGFVWVKYSDFAKYVDQAYEIFVRKQQPDPKPGPQPKPQPKPDPKPQPRPVNLNSFSGEIDLQLSTGEKMVPVLNSRSGLPTYKIAGEYVSRTRYRIYISNNEPAYVYVIGSDLKNSVSKVFPPAGNISAALTYKSNHIAIPDERYYVEMDNTPGTDYMCVLYSKNALDINGIIGRIRSAGGTFHNKVKQAVAGLIAPESDIRCTLNNIGFSARTEKTVVPVIVEITHK